MRIIAVDDERLALEALVSSIVKAVPDAAVHGFRDPCRGHGFSPQSYLRRGVSGHPNAGHQRP